MSLRSEVVEKFPTSGPGESDGSAQLCARDLPVLFDGDVVVLGGSFAGVSAALALAGAGYSVYLVEPRTYLGCEVSARLRPWLDLAANTVDETAPQARRGDSPVSTAGKMLPEPLPERLPGRTPELFPESLPEPLRTFLEQLGGTPNDGTVQFRMDALKVSLEDQCLAVGIGLLYATLPLAVRGDGSGGTDVVVGNKAGCQVLRCREVLDVGPLHRDQEVVVSRVLEFDGVAGPLPPSLPAPVELLLEGDIVRLRHGYRGQKHVFVECAMRIPEVGVSAFAVTQREIAARLRSMDVAVHLMNEVPAFAKAYFAGSSYEVGVPGDEEPVGACRRGAELAERLSLRLGGPEPAAANAARPAIRSRLPVPAQDVPVVRDCDVLVVGGGSSGATAAICAAREGVRTVLVDMNPGLGGTGTYGGVNDYWFGRRAGFAAQLSAAVDEVHDRLRHARPSGEVPYWNIEAKAHVLLRDANEAGVEVLLNAFAVEAMVEDRVVTGVIFATRRGPVAVRAGVVIDATGDGDVAVSAGARYSYGSERDHVTMWYSLAQFALPGRTRNNFTSAVNVGDPEDYTRAILAGRRRKRDGADNHDHGIYVAPRESRHVLGDVTLTLSDQLLKRCWHDTVNLAFSNNDVKGPTTSDWVRLGLISPNLEVEVPYRALLPKGVENLIIAGKAVSASHDALPAIRMQADLENLGGVAALAAVEAIRTGMRPRDVDVRRLQERLVEADVLPMKMLERQLLPWRPDRAELRRLIDEIPWEQPLYWYSNMKINEVFEGRIPIVDLACSGPQVVTLLEEALRTAAGPRRLRLAQALAVIGSVAGVPALIEAVEEQLGVGDGLPSRAEGILHAQPSPDQGAMPEVVYLLHALGMTRDRRAVPVLERVVDHLVGATDAEVRDKNRGIFDYVDAVAVAAERLGDPSAARLLERLHECPTFSNRVARSGFQVDYFEERQAHLELVIGRALARCGARSGYEILIDYLVDCRSLLGAHAHSELRSITGEDRGLDPADWRTWLLANESALAPAPWTAPSDPVAVWGEEILVAAS